MPCFRLWLIAVIILFGITSCRTNTVLDGFIYESYPILLQVYNTKYSKICNAMEQVSYNLNEFTIYKEGIHVIYPNGEEADYFYRSSILLSVITDIERDFQTNSIPEEIQIELLNLSQQLCYFLQGEAHILGFVNLDVGITLWDPINGVRVIYSTENFEGNCATLAGGYGFGAYGQEDLFGNSVCTIPGE